MANIRFGLLSWIIYCAMSLAIGIPTAIAGTQLLGTTSDGDSGTSSLVELAIGDGNLTETIGDVGYLVNGMAWDDTTDTLYASTSVNDGNFTGLITIDIHTGAGTEVGAADWGQAAGYSVSNITIDSDGNIFGWADNTDELVTIDEDTGEATVSISSTGVAAADFGLAFDRINRLFIVNGNGDLFVLADDDTFVGPGGDLTAIARQGDFYPTGSIYWGINNSGTDTRELVLVDVDLESENERDRLTTEDQLQTLVFISTSSNSDSGSSSRFCFIDSVRNGY